MRTLPCGHLNADAVAPGRLLSTYTRSARPAKRIDPILKKNIIGRLQVEEFDAESDAGFHDAYSDERFEGLIFPRKSQAGSRVDRHRFAGTNEATPERNVRSDALYPLAGLQVDEFGIGGKRITDGITPVAHALEARGKGRGAFWHGDDLGHQ